jgi:penicillin-binding protein 1A
MGYSKYVAVGVWVGNHDSKPMYTFAEPMVGPIWNQFMRDYHKGKKDQKFEKPEGIKNVKIDRATGRNASSNSRQVISDIAPKWFEGVKAGNSTKVTIDKVSKKLATNCTPELAKQESSSNSIAPELPTDDPMFSAWAKGAGYTAAGSGSTKDKDDIHKCSDAKPDITSFSVVGTDFDVSYNQGTHSLEGGYVSYYVDGKLVKTCKIPSGCASTSSSSYTYGGSISSKVRVEVVDKVFYHDEATENTSSGGSFDYNVNTSNCNGGDCDVTLTWLAYPGADNYQVCGFPGGCQASDTLTSFSDEFNHGDYDVTVTARSGGTTLASATKEIELDN